MTPRHPHPRILFASSEALHLVKTGGLADVTTGLTDALHSRGGDVRLILPAYPKAVDKTMPLELVATLDLPGSALPVRLLQGRFPESGIPLYLVDAPHYFHRAGNPYTGPDGDDWPDNALRFGAFCRTIVELAMGRVGLDWRPEVVHCNDWQTGLVPPLLAREPQRPATLFTIHNLAYQGLFSRVEFELLDLPDELWSAAGLEFYGGLSFIKGGIAFADKVTTVSPTYAREILSPEFGYGLDGLLVHRGGDFVGLLNGADYAAWNPATDRRIAINYSANELARRAENKTALQREMGLPESTAPLFGHIGRLVEQKGVDMILGALDAILADGGQLVVLGAGNELLRRGLEKAAALHPTQVAIHIGYDEGLAHRIEAGADCFLMPSRFEPCGLNQIYSMRYGAVPLVRATGGLADTVVDASPDAILDGSATGFVFADASAAALAETVMRVQRLYRESPELWRQLMLNGMRRDFSWERSAEHYLGLYEIALEATAGTPAQHA